MNSSKLSSWWSEGADGEPAAAPAEAWTVRTAVVEKVRVVLLERTGEGRRMMDEAR